MTNPFDFVNAITRTKEDLIKNSPDPALTEKDYNAFLVNRHLSYFVNTIFYANDMNMYPNSDGKLQFDYYLNTVRPFKKFAKWHKKEDDEDLNAVQEYFNYSYSKALDALSVLSKEQITEIKQIIRKGGLEE